MKYLKTFLIAVLTCAMLAGSVYADIAGAIDEPAVSVLPTVFVLAVVVIAAAVLGKILRKKK